MLAGRAAGSLSRLLRRGAGGTLPGRVALALRPQLIGTLSADRRLVLVSGTNGKSTTTRLLTVALSLVGPVVSNADGANLLSGLAAALMADAGGTGTAVLEVDELVLPAALRTMRPAVVVLLNLSRDQLDRVEEVHSHVGRWARALRESPDVHVVANADDPLVVAAVWEGRRSEVGVTWVAAGAPWRADAVLCPRCGDAWSLQGDAWACADCGLTRPDPSWQLGSGGELIDPTGASRPLGLALPGRASAANAVMAAAAADLLGVPVVEAIRSFSGIRDVDGRYLRVDVDGRDVRLLLAKNPAGWLEVLAQLTSDTGGILLGLNARTADGTDPSWLWDVPFEQLRGRRLAVFGDRSLDMSVRLHYAEVAHDVVPDVGSGLAALAGMPVNVAANYTAFVTARAALRAAAA
jgi:UDP-N-acetylmuramyl tripeptide synthase